MAQTIKVAVVSCWEGEGVEEGGEGEGEGEEVLGRREEQ